MQRVTTCLQRIMSSNAAGRPPSLSSAAVAKLVKEYFYFQHIDEQSVKQLPSYDDRNFYFRGTVAPGTAANISSSMSLGEYVLKLNNPLLASYDVLKGINDLLNHLHLKGFTKCNQPLSGREGGDLLKITKDKLLEYESHLEPTENVDQSSKYTCTFFLRVLTFIPGECFDKVDKHCLTPRLLYDVGHCIGSAEAILQETFHNPYLERRTLVQWDLNHLLTYRKLLPHLENDKERKMAELVLDAFEQHVCPKIPNFKKGIIHGDANGLNIIIQRDNLDEYQMVGLIDFGDCVFSCHVFDLGILLAYVMAENLNLETRNGISPIEFVAPILHGYTNAFPLSREEIDCLYYIAMARCCQSCLNGALSFKREPWNTYLLISPAKCWRVIELMLSTSKEKVDEIWANAL